MRNVLMGVGLALSAGCATVAQMGVTKIGTDVMVVQYTQDGQPSHCWKLRNTTLSAYGNGSLQWVDLASTNTMHVSGRTNYTKVEFGNFEAAAKALGVDAGRCDYGVYPARDDRARTNQ